MRNPLVLLLVPSLLTMGCGPSEGSDESTEAETASSNDQDAYGQDESEEPSDPGLDEDTGQGDDTGLEQTDVGVLSSGTYFLNTSPDDWITDTCGVAEHVSNDVPIEVEVYGSWFIIGDLWSTDEAGIQDDGDFTMQDGLSTTDDYGEGCQVTFTIAEGAGQVVDDDHFEILFTTKRTGEGDCTVALTELDTLPCEETRTWHLAK